GIARPLDRRCGEEMARELNAYADADGVLTVSRKEADLLHELTGRAALAFAVADAEDLPASPGPFADRRGVLFVGNFRHAPNVDAVEFLCRHVYPHLDPGLLAEHPVTVVGNALTDGVRRHAAGRPGVTVVGWVPDLVPYLHH